MLNYRNTLYGNYHSTQSGRASRTDAASLFGREYRQFKREILPHLHVSKDANIFDLGCGSGSLLKALQDAGFTQTSGMDISPEQVQMASKMGVSHVSLGDALQQVKTTVAAYDVILGADIIEHFTKDELIDLLEGIHRALKPGGIAIFRTPNLDAPMSSVFANGDFTHENYLNASSAQQVLMACGFTTVQVKPSVMFIENPLKEFLRKIFWGFFKLRLKIQLFATARSSQNVIFTPNLIIIAQKTNG
jgi:2-polyprenyl-3-methyl-5-hydroxy-6-metoxy-1,4-benzoquinol methylase